MSLNRALTKWTDVHYQDKRLKKISRRILYQWTQKMFVRYVAHLRPKYVYAPVNHFPFMAMFVAPCIRMCTSLAQSHKNAHRAFELWCETCQEQQRFARLIGNTLWRKGQQSLALAFDDWLEHATDQKHDEHLDLIPSKFYKSQPLRPCATCIEFTLFEFSAQPTF